MRLRSHSREMFLSLVCHNQERQLPAGQPILLLFREEMVVFGEDRMLLVEHLLHPHHALGGRYGNFLHKESLPAPSI
jgi:hypothetical protein